MTIDTTKLMNFPEVYSATGMMELIQQIGFLPLLDSGIEGFSAEDIVAEDCGYVRLLKAVGTGHYGNGRARLCRKCRVCTESSSTRKQDSSARNGGRTSATTEEANPPIRMKNR